MNPGTDDKMELMNFAEEKVDLRKLILKDNDAGSEYVTVFSPATIGNCGPGFDVLGACLQGPGDILQARKLHEKTIKLKVFAEKGRVSEDSNENLASIAVKAIMDELNIDEGVELVLHKGLPVGSGLGSSSASICAGLVAANELFGNKLSKEKLLEIGINLEPGKHADNLAPCLFGGFVNITSSNPLGIDKLGIVNDLIFVVVKPDIEIRTEEARDIIKWDEIKEEDKNRNEENLQNLISAIKNNNFELAAKNMVDNVVEPFRAKLIPGFNEVKTAALDVGASAFSISGSGPSVFAATNDIKIALDIQKSMEKVFNCRGIETFSIITRVSDQGTRII
ncbi:homoserine kinase [Nanoarchaeota archaeon]